MRRSFGTAAAVLISWSALGGCYLGPDPVQIAALAVIDGRPTAVLAACGKTSVGVELSLDDAVEGQITRWSVTVDVPEGAERVDVELFGKARPGWDVTTENTGGILSVVPLTAIEPGRSYLLDSANYGPEGSVAPRLAFTAADLPRIGPGQVLATAGRERSEIMSLDTFVDERCRASLAE
ncbi:hypothetical protein ACIBSW_30830 [Actinoplanes sp. NPDC049668]|uniref:hypothetical protein n=1 Tax=unclassified Actinoplanes TaxID=2626549 RepID=UPI0033AFA7B0